ncbi:hypothetical protein LJC71_01765 [Desulfosarcina sp. OttesenSCG-928-A07]|nr:hypothetical protein [Desulfosarcina sp. OttesenSCG-928-G17]MDL2328464.1 hypothetical protein [Desulfosarcina sp. OttesenSCG-928-A07]
MEPIKRRQFSSPDQQRVQDEVISAVETDPQKFIDRYKALPQSFGGRYVNSDLFKETFDQYSESKESRNRYNIPVHNAAAVMASEQFRRVLQLPPEVCRNTVILLTGIPGAGKTSSVMGKNQFPPHIHAVFEGQLATPETTSAKVQQVLDAGLKPAIVVIHPMPEKALDNTIERFDEQGRGAGIYTLAKIMGELPIGLSEVRDKFGDQVQLEIMDRRADFSNPVLLKGWQQLSVLQSEGNYEQIRSRLERHLETRRDSISIEAWRQAAGGQPLGRDQSRRVVDRERTENLTRSGVAGQNQEAAVLSDREGPQAKYFQELSTAFCQASEKASKKNPIESILGKHPELSGAVSARKIICEDINFTNSFFNPDNVTRLKLATDGLCRRITDGHLKFDEKEINSIKSVAIQQHKKLDTER